MVRREQITAEDHAAPCVDYQQHVREVRTIPLILDGRGEHEEVHLQTHFPSRQPPESLDLGHLHLDLDGRSVQRRHTRRSIFPETPPTILARGAKQVALAA